MVCFAQGARGDFMEKLDLSGAVVRAPLVYGVKVLPLKVQTRPAHGQLGVKTKRG